MPYLILVRHGKSVWNKLGLWAGHMDIDLDEDGRKEAEQAGKAIADIPIHKIHVSAMSRTLQTLHHIKEALGLHHLKHKSHDDLKERDYGVHTGKNKWQVKDEIGEEEFRKLRRGWDVSVPGGETLKDVYTRVSSAYNAHIKPDILAGHNTLVVGNGNALRALVKEVENLSEDEVCSLEIGTGEVYCYKMDDAGRVLDKEIRSANENTGKI